MSVGQYNPVSGRIQGSVAIEQVNIEFDVALTAYSTGTSLAARVGTRLGAEAVADGSFYSVAYEMNLANGSYPGVYRGPHFLEANKALTASIASDAEFASSIARLGIEVPRSPTGAILGKSPTNWV